MEVLLQKDLVGWEKLLLPQPGGKAVLQALLDAYSDPDRFYHTLEHIAEMTLLLAEYRDLMSGTADAFLACLWHDVVYNAKSADNEEQSAIVWRSDAQKLQVAPEQTERVAELILATRKHQPTNDSVDMQLFLDADLAILGAEPKRYERYAHGVRYEYAHVPESDYRPGRSAVLKKFLERPQLYFSKEFQTRFTPQARRNLSLEIQVLGRKDSFKGEFSENASGLLTYNIDQALSTFYDAFKKHLAEHFAFSEFSEPIWSPDSTIGTCGNGKIKLEWGHDFYQGFYFYSSDTGGSDIVRKIGDYFNGILANVEFNIYRTYLFVDFNPLT